MGYMSAIGRPHRVVVVELVVSELAQVSGTGIRHKDLQVVLLPSGATMEGDIGPVGRLHRPVVNVIVVSELGESPCFHVHHEDVEIPVTVVLEGDT